MNCHQILSGACNAGDRCYAVGSVEGISFTAYAAGCNIVILANNFERVQIIPGAVHNYIRISCLDCSTDTGKIAAAYENQVCIFEPTPLIHSTCSHQLEYRWVQTGSLQTESNITSLSWNLEGTRLLTGGELLQLWHQNIMPFQEEHTILPTSTKPKTLQTEEVSTTGNNHNITANTSQDPGTVTFSIGGEAESPGPGDTSIANDPGGWNCVWKCRTATPVHLMSFSPDGTLFATTGMNDRLVKIWFENKQLFPARSIDHTSFSQSVGSDNFSFVYVAHPRAVTHLSWRKTSKYMPKGSVSNMLVTSCRDNICRVWAETIPPEIEGLANMSQFEGSDRHGHHGKHRHHNMHKHRFMQRLKHMKTCFHIRRHAKQQHQAGHTAPTLPTLPSTYSVHDFHNNYQTSGHYPGMHFHLAASINAETDIPLVPSLITGDPDREPNFILHWLNNKEMHFTMQAENILQELTRKVVEKEEGLQHQDAEHVEHDSEDECTPKKGVRLQTTAQKPVVGGRSMSQEDHSSDEHHTAHTTSSHHSLAHSVHSHPSLSNTTSINSIATDATSTMNHAPDSLDTKIETLLRDWHHNPDLLFSIHPIDGSFLIWHIEWLDEYHPGSFRQAQISFSTRIPNAFPLGDASTMSHNVSMYSHNTGGPLLNIREVAKSSTKSDPSEVATPLPSLIEQDEEQSTLTSKAGQELLKNLENTNDHNQTKTETNALENNKNGQDADLLAHPSPIVSMVSKHSNGTLNLWQLTFADKTKFSQVLSIGHACRASGHRFRVNDITCHPVLPLLVTTSHHNIPEFSGTQSTESNENLCSKHDSCKDKDIMSPTGFCSELILWRVDAVGPLSKSGGVSELARINSPEISAFSNVAWIPTLLPSTTLGNLSNSPSACFVASDGECLRVYQAVIDARTLLAEVSISERRSRMMDSMASLSTDMSSDDGVRHSIHDRIKIVSQQSTARPGCVIQLDAIADATHDWQNTQFLHVFQEQLITGERSDEKLPGIDTSANDLGLMESTLDAMVDLQQSTIFEEPFYIVVLERTQQGTTVHMWRLVIASQPETTGLSGSMMYVPDSHLVQDEDDEGTPGRLSHAEGRRSRRASQTGGRSRRDSQADLDSTFLPRRHQNSHVLITTTKVCTQELPLPDGVEVIHAAPAAGHLSSSSIYPACFAPYIIVTACSDSTVRFWKCKVTKRPDDKLDYEWCEWEMTRKDQESTIDITGQPLNISAAYSGRIACAYKYGKSFTRPTKSDPDSRYVNLCVAIYECESTGGSEWILEDTIHLKNIHLPRIPVDQHLDLSYLYDSRFLQKKQRLTQVLQTLSHEDIRSSRNGENGDSTKAGLLAVPSFSTLQSLRKSIIENGNTCPLTQKHLVQLDWVSKEDGSHILTVGVGSKIMLFTPVCSDLAQANMKAMKESQSNNRPILRKTSSLAQPQFVDEIRWMKLRKIELTTADGLPPLPMQISWVRDGILVVGMDSEMHVYSQWKPNPKNDCFHSNLQHQESDEFQASRNLRDEDLRTLAHETSQRRLANVSSMPHLSRVSSINLTMLDAKKKRGIQNENLSFDYMPDYGLFEASRIACPVLPQYHPKQLMELLNSGKIRWVKAILAHLVRCIGSSCSLRADDENLVKQRGGWSRSRTMSVSYMGTTSPLEPRGSTTQIPEELTLDYAEITSISPLPLWTLLMADKETNLPHQQNEDKHDYNELFDSNLDEGESLDDMLDEDYECSRQKDRRSSVPERQGISHFGPRQGRLLSRLLTHTHLPGLSSLDQMHLLALADTVSTCNVDFAERFAIDAAKNAIAKENLTGIPDGETVSTDSLDDCGLRFLLAMKHYNYLIRCLPLAQRAQFQKQGIASNNLVWAFHSESEEELLGLIPSYAKGQPKWSVLKELGVGWWIRSNTVLKKCVDKIAKAAFQDKQDPLDAAVYYLAMKKKNLVWGLFRNKRDERMTTFFSNNFAENRWRKAALKNAFALLGKQRFDHAAAFFLLAGALKDAIDVCLNKLNDIQLAMVIARLYENDTSSPNMRRLLYEEILGCDKDGQNQDMSRVHPDPFLRSMALWILKDYSGSLNTLLLTNVGNMHPQYNDESDKPEGTTANPNVFNFYVYLRTHPLLIRQYIASTAQDKKKGHSVVISGFSYGTETKSQPDKQLLLEDTITPLERQLYFTTAHAHFKAGCPALALEVLSKLPNKVMETNGEDSPSLLNSPSKIRAQDSQIDTGIINWGNESIAVNNNEETAAVDWNTSSFDWSQSKRMEEDKLELSWDDDETGEGEDADSPPMSMKFDKKEPDNNAHKTENDNKDVIKSAGQLDIMAQQLKFVACLKILMEELSTLATGFEVDGGQLRYQLYVWLEREVDALRQLCSYSTNADGDVNNVADYEGGMVDDVPPYKPGEQPTLHQILVAEKLDFEAKVQRAAKRKKWLKANETLLRTLLSYCSLHGASGGGLASVRMELVLLLQELQQEKTQQQLLSPLPFPTTLPLLSASVACNKTVVADPVRHLQSLAHDMLQTLVELRNPPMPNRNTHYCEVFIMRDLAVALSACIYQSLCDSDTFVMKHHQPESFPAVAEVETGGHLVASNRYHRRYSTDDGVCITTSPSKWPGVTNLRALLAREKDEDTPKLNILLCEAFVATYMSLFIYALSSCDSHILYRLVGQHFDNSTWSCLFGGGVKKLLRVASTTSQGGNTNSVERTDSVASEIQSTASGMWNTMTSLTKQRVKLNMKLLGQFTGQQPNMKEDKPTYREQFVSPQMSMISYFLMKPRIETEYADEIDYDSSDSAVSDLDSTDDEEDVFDTGSKPKNKPKDNTEHSNSNSYSWSVMRLAIVKILQQQLQDFLTIAGIEMQELPVSSPLTHGTLGIVAQWQESLREELELKGPPPANYIPGCAPDPSPTPGKPAIHKYRSLLEKGNTPFNTRLASAAPTNRLWCYLVRQELVQDIFIRAVFGKRRSLSTILESSQSVVDGIHRGTGEDKGSDSGTTSLPEPVRIIHKEQDSISAFCLNQVNPGLMALATPREVQEMNISLLLELPSWLEDECEFDIINLNKQPDPEPVPPTSFLVIQTAADRPLLAQSPQQNSPQPHSGIASQSGRGASVILKHKIDGIRRISSHPLLPLYLTGSQDGSVSLWEWGHQTAVATPRAPGTFAKVTRVRFSQHGNKFGVADSDGHLSLFQVACREGTARPFFTYQCHSKVTSDFVFLGACSLVATAGHGSEGRNVALWDTLLPQNKSLVQGFMCHDQGASALILAPQHQLLISGGKKGDINIFDVRQRQQRQRFQAHESAIKCLALDPHEEFFVSGAGDGDIKIWGLTVHSLLYSFPSEHPRSSFFKNIGQGVTQLHVDSAGRLFSCGADGSMKVRQLPERDCVIQTLY